MFAILLILIFIRPFISSLAFPYLNAGYSGLLLIFLILWLIHKGIPIKTIQAIQYPLVLFSLALIISVVFSINRFNSLKEIYKYVTGLFLFIIAASLNYTDKIRVINTIISAGFIIGLLAIYQYFFGFRILLNYTLKANITDTFTLDYIMRRRVFFPFVTPNTLAGYLAMVIPLALTPKNKIRYIIPLSFALLLTTSLSALLSIFLALTIYYYLKGRFKKEGGLFVSGVLVIIGLVFIARSMTQKQHLQPIFSTMMRLNYWKDTLRIIKTHPLAGVGLGNFNLLQSRYAHNSYLQLWAELGVFGLIAFLCLIINIFKHGLKNIKNSTYKNQITALTTATAVFLIHNFFDFTFFLPEVAIIWWVVLGMIYTKEK